MMVDQNKMKEDDLLNDKEVTVYWGEGCVPCQSTKYWLAKKGIEYKAVEVTADNMNELGIMSVPVVEVITKSESGGSLKESWTGFDARKLAGALL